MNDTGAPGQGRDPLSRPPAQRPAALVLVFRSHASYRFPDQRQRLRATRPGSMRAASIQRQLLHSVLRSPAPRYAPLFRSTPTALLHSAPRCTALHDSSRRHHPDSVRRMAAPRLAHPHGSSPTSLFVSTNFAATRNEAPPRYAHNSFRLLAASPNAPRLCADFAPPSHLVTTSFFPTLLVSAPTSLRRADPRISVRCFADFARHLVSTPHCATQRHRSTSVLLVASPRNPFQCGLLRSVRRCSTCLDSSRRERINAALVDSAQPSEPQIDSPPTSPLVSDRSPAPLRHSALRTANVSSRIDSTRLLSEKLTPTPTPPLLSSHCDAKLPIANVSARRVAQRLRATSLLSPPTSQIVSPPLRAKSLPATPTFRTRSVHPRSMPHGSTQLYSSPTPRFYSTSLGSCPLDSSPTPRIGSRLRGSSRRNADCSVRLHATRIISEQRQPSGSRLLSATRRRSLPSALFLSTRLVSSYLTAIGSAQPNVDRTGTMHRRHGLASRIYSSRINSDRT